MWQDERYTQVEKKAFIGGYIFGKMQDWQGAKDYCRGLTLGGFNDWYLPSKDELLSIVDNSRKPAIRKEFKNTVSSLYWSSSVGVSDSRYAWGVKFEYGFFFNNYNAYNFYVRCARAGQ